MFATGAVVKKKGGWTVKSITGLLAVLTAVLAIVKGRSKL